MTDTMMDESEYKDFFRDHQVFLKYRFTDMNDEPLTDEHYDGLDCDWMQEAFMQPVLFKAMFRGPGYISGDQSFKVLNSDVLVLTVKKDGMSPKALIDYGNRWATEIHRCLHDYERQKLDNDYVLDLDEIALRENNDND